MTARPTAKPATLLKAPWRRRGREENEDQEECHDAFEQHRVPAGEIGGESRSDGAERIGLQRIGDDDGEQVRGDDGPEKLRDPVEEALDGAEALRHPEADRDGGIQVAAGNVSDRGDHNGDGEAVGDGDAKKRDAPCRWSGDIGRRRSASAKENQRESPEEFSEQFLGQAVQAVPPGKARREREGAIAPRAILLNNGDKLKDGK